MKLSFFPQEKQNIKLRIPKEILITELSRHIEFGGSSQVWFKNNDKDFAGQKSGERFEIKLRTSYSDSFKPKVYISFFEYDKYTEIEIVYKLELIKKVLVIIFIVFFLLLQSLFIPLNVKAFIDSFNYEDLIPLGLILFLWIFMRMGFYTNYIMILA